MAIMSNLQYTIHKVHENKKATIVQTDNVHNYFSDAKDLQEKAVKRAGGRIY